MKIEYSPNFDTHAAVKQLQTAGLKDKVAEAIVDSISISRRTDLSNLVSKDDFFDFKKEVNEKFNKMENSINSLKKDTKVDIESLKTQIANSKNDMFKWMIGLFMAQMTTMVVLFLTR